MNEWMDGWIEVYHFYDYTKMSVMMLFCFRIHLNISGKLMIPTYDSRISLMIYKLSPVAKLPSKIALFDT